jgi:hypothetical protein
VRHHQLAVTNTVGFIERLGLAATPTTLVLDSDFTVRLIPKRATPETIEYVSGMFAGTTSLMGG